MDKKDKYIHSLEDVIESAMEDGLTENEILFHLNELKKEIQDYGLIGAIRPNQWLK